MNISKYEFHDGTIIDIKHINNNIEISMESSEIDPEEISEKITLSKNYTIKGILHIEGIKTIKEDKKIYEKKIIKNFDLGEILHFKIKNNKVELLIQWENLSSQMKIIDVTDFKIEAEKIWWENVPDLVDPFE